MEKRPATEQEIEVIQAAAKRLRAGIVAIVFGMVCGMGLFIATVWLLVRGGPMVGQTLNLLGNYFPGYRVSGWGSLLGLLYGTLFGAILGYTTALIYNLVTKARSKQARSDVYRGL